MPDRDVTKSIFTSELLIVQNLKRYVLLGGPGSGKSIISQFLILEQLKPSKSQCASNSFITGIPFAVTIRELAFARSKQSDITIIDYITEQVNQFVGKAPPSGFVDFWLKRDESVVIFDGLDEVIIPEERQIIRDLIASFSARFPNARVIVTSRFVGYNEMPLNNNYFLHFNINIFNNIQKENFVKKWYAERETNPIERERAIKGFLEAITDDRVNELANNPLLLTIMALVHNSEHDLPKQRAILYKKCVEAFIVNRERAKELLLYNAKEILDCHDYLGYCIQTKAENTEDKSIVISSEELKQTLTKFIINKNQPTNLSEELIQQKVDEFITAARRRVGLIVEQGESRWTFGHKSFQEYFAAHYISQTTAGLSEIWEEIEKKVENPHWTEPIKLLAGICGDFSPKLLHALVGKLLDEYKRSNDQEKKRLILAGEIAGEIELSFTDQEMIARELVSQFIEVHDTNVFTNIKRVMNNFYNNPTLWDYMIKTLKERVNCFKQNPFFYSTTAYYRSYDSRHFADARIDRILATL